MDWSWVARLEVLGPTAVIVMGSLLFGRQLLKEARRFLEVRAVLRSKAGVSGRRIEISPDGHIVIGPKDEDPGDRTPSKKDRAVQTDDVIPIQRKRTTRRRRRRRPPGQRTA